MTTSKYHLNLSQPNFWNKPDPAADGTWQNAAATLSSPASTGQFWLLDGPPYANGEAHLGHVLNKCVKDAYVRFERAKGSQVVWRAGWDCHGLPLELAAQKRPDAPDRRDPAFLAACREEASFWMARQSSAFSRLATCADTDAPWTTMDPAREAKGMLLLRDMWAAGLLVERASPTHWCPACQSALAASELEKKLLPKDSLYAFAEFDKDSSGLVAKLAGLEDSSLPVGLCFWTTTPWTLPANQAFAFPESAQMAAFEHGGRVFLACASAGPRLAAAFGSSELSVLATFPASSLSGLGLLAWSPVQARLVPVAAAPFASEADGSGFVHVAPAFGPEDFEWAESRPDLGLSLACPVERNGSYGDCGAFSGLSRPQAALACLDSLRAAGRELAFSSTQAEANVCWRHGAPTFLRASRQWALDLDKPFEGCPEGLRARAAASLDAMRFLPTDKAKNGLARMLEGRRFWTLSRDRTWGLPLPMLRDAEGVLSSSTAEWWGLAAQAVAVGGVEAYARMQAPDGLFKEGQCVDVWFDSGAAFETAFEPGFERPTMVVEGADQTRGWFLSSMLLGAFRSAAPVFETVACHGFVVDDKGRKLSKSLGNAPDTQKLFEEHGADALRLWALSQSLGQDVAWSKGSLAQAKGDLKDWRNFLRFLLAHQSGGGARPTPATPLEHLALRQMDEAQAAWRSGFESGEPQAALAALADMRRWASSTLFELSKRDLYCAAPSSPERGSKGRLFAWMLSQSLAMLAPFMPLSCAHAASEAGFAPGSLEPLGGFDPLLADQAASALAWRDAQHRRLEDERLAGGSFKAKFEATDSEAARVAEALGVGAEHLVRGVSFNPERHTAGAVAWRLSEGWECPRCRGLFCAAPHAHEPLQDGQAETLCAQCEGDENRWVAESGGLGGG